MKKPVIPKFKSEAEDARWHQRHKRTIESAMERRIRAGKTMNLREMAERNRLRPITIRLATEDVEAARLLAAEKGIGYQTYIKILLREALERESQRR